MRTLTTEHEPGDTGGAATPISMECITCLPVLRIGLVYIGMIGMVGKNNVDNNGWSHDNCAVKQREAWWYCRCSYSNLNRVYHQSASAPEYIEIYWTSWHIIMRTLTTEHEPGDTGGAATPISTECITCLPVLRIGLVYIGMIGMVGKTMWTIMAGHMTTVL